MTLYTCQGCTQTISPGQGYIHTSAYGQWEIHHRSCAGDLTEHVCYGLTADGLDIYRLHRASRERTPA